MRGKQLLVYLVNKPQHAARLWHGFRLEMALDRVKHLKNRIASESTIAQLLWASSNSTTGLKAPKY